MWGQLKKKRGTRKTLRAYEVGREEQVGREARGKEDTPQGGQSPERGGLKEELLNPPTNTFWQSKRGRCVVWGRGQESGQALGFQ